MSATGPQSTLLSRLFGPGPAGGLSLQAACNLGVKWQALPAPVRRGLCLKYFDEPASAGPLPNLREMAEMSEFDGRLVALCIKLHCEREFYSEAYRTLELCLLKRTKDFLRSPQRMIRSELRRYVSDIRLVVHLWDRVDAESRSDTADKHVVGEEVKHLFALLSRDYENLVPHLAAPESKLIFALLDLAQLIGTEQHIGEVYDLCARSSAKSDIGAYARFMASLRSALIHSKLPNWQRYLGE
ncbi:MAG: hypothetical protein ACREXY_28185, partial [Gammaproteobacteria bacterium]